MMSYSSSRSNHDLPDVNLELQPNNPIIIIGPGSERSATDQRYGHEHDAKHHNSPLSERNHKDTPNSSAETQYISVPEHNWKTTFYIIGSYIIALLLAISHVEFFRALDGKDVNAPLNIRQSYVSTISFLLMTGFRTAITSTLGICFTQHFWRLLRKKALKVSLIEDLFQVRSNVLGLTNPQILRRAPLLFMAASIIWLAPLATVYPPGALTILTEPRWALAAVNGSILNPPPSASGSLAIYTRIDMGGDIAYSDSGPTQPLENLARFVMTSGQIVSMSPLTGANSSYQSTFRAPLVKCHNDSAVNITSRIRDVTGINEFESTWDAKSLTVKHKTPVGFYPLTSCPNQEFIKYHSWNFTATMVSEQRSMKCYPYTATYEVNISYERMVQHIEYSVKDLERLNHDIMSYSKAPQITPDDDWEKVIPWSFRQKANSFGILHSLFSNMQYSFDARFSEATCIAPRVVGKFQTDNGSEVALGSLYTTVVGDDYKTKMQDSPFNTIRFSTNRSVFFDPAIHINITEELINSMLANISISALSLNTWYGPITVNNTEYINVYRFSHPLNLFLPYGLCLGLTLLFMGVGLLSLHRNGVSATDGGFLQLVMTTTGDTAMNRAAVSGSLDGKDNAPKELLNMKVRFGKFVGERKKDEIWEAGFGTVEETAPLRERSVYGEERAG